jgi:hypothetical protein
MRFSIRRIATRLIVANLLVLPVLVLFITLTTCNAAAADVSGTWSSNVSGKGYVQTSHILDTNSDVKLVMEQNGNSITGTIVTTCSYSYLHSGYQTWGSPAVGSKNTNSVTGTLSGSTLTLTCYSPATSGTSGGVSYTTDATTTTWTLHLNGNKLTGSGTYTAAGIAYSYTFDLVSGGASGTSGFSNFGLGIPGLSNQLTIPVLVGFVGGIACLAASFVPLPKGRFPQGPTSSGSSYYNQPSNVGTTAVDSGAPTDPTYMGGAGLSYPQDYINGEPVKPRNWQSQQHGPLCPVHGTMCNANYLNSLDPGAWFCPKCAEQGRDGFPWGRQQ